MGNGKICGMLVVGRGRVESGMEGGEKRERVESGRWAGSFGMEGGGEEERVESWDRGLHVSFEMPYFQV